MGAEGERSCTGRDRDRDRDRDLIRFTTHAPIAQPLTIEECRTQQGRLSACASAGLFRGHRPALKGRGGRALPVYACAEWSTGSGWIIERKGACACPCAVSPAVAPVSVPALSLSCHVRAPGGTGPEPAGPRVSGGEPGRGLGDRLLHTRASRLGPERPPGGVLRGITPGVT